MIVTRDGWGREVVDSEAAGCLESSLGMYRLTLPSDWTRRATEEDLLFDLIGGSLVLDGSVAGWIRLLDWDSDLPRPDLDLGCFWPDLPFSDELLICFLDDISRLFAN